MLIANGIIDLYIYIQARHRCRDTRWSRLQLITAIALAVGLIVEICLPAKRGGDTQLLGKMWLLFAYLTIYFPKYIAVVFDILASLPKLWTAHRIKPLTITGIILGGATFVAMWWGALVNRFNIHVNEVEIAVPALPTQFNGMRIVQFSDLHTGTFGNDTTYVSRLVDKINGLHPDVIVFTGDIVNRRSEEMIPFVDILSRLTAPLGVYAILGNHDYGDYMHWHTEADKEANMRLLYDLYSDTGIKLLRNETHWLHNGTDSIALIGVENIGDPPFKTYGSLKASYPDVADPHTKILLSHNPQHWVDSICHNPQSNIALTLSGHTHAMQIEVAGISPAAMRYETWGGLYAGNINNRKLYVNIGCGTVGLPMRVGATPEITVITLQRFHD